MTTTNSAPTRRRFQTPRRTRPSAQRGPVAARLFDLPSFAADGRRFDNPRRVPIYDHDGHLLGTARRVWSSDADRYLAPCRLDDRAAFGRWDRHGRLWFVKLSAPTR